MSRLRWVAIVPAAVATVWWLWPTSPVPLTAPGEALVAPSVQLPADLPDSSGPGSEAARQVDVVVEAAQSVAGECGLEVRTACDARGCAVVSVVPNLSSVWGWARLATESPRFVASHLLQPAGVSDGCFRSTETLMSAGQPVARYAPDGREVWCVSPDMGLCDAAAALVGPEAVGFQDESDRLRRLRWGQSSPR